MGAHACPEVVAWEHENEASHPQTLPDSAGGLGLIPNPRLNVVLFVEACMPFAKKSSRQGNELLCLKAQFFFLLGKCREIECFESQIHRNSPSFTLCLGLFDKAVYSPRPTVGPQG